MATLYADTPAPVEKVCTHCRETKPVDQFHSVSYNADRLANWCKSCMNLYYQDRYKNKRKNYWNNHLRKQYGITADEYNAIFEKQDGKCALCGNPETHLFKGNARALHLDHDHKTGKVRGLLCWSCNNAIALFRDNPELCEKAADYLRKHSG